MTADLEMPYEIWLMEQAGVSDLPAVIPDWVLDPTPMAELLDRAPVCACEDEGGGSEPLRPGLDRPATLADLDPDAFVMPVPEPTAVSDAVRELQRAVEAVLAQDPTSLPEPRALADTEAVMECSRKLRVGELDRIADVQHRDLHELAGHSSPRSWLLDVQPDADPTDVRFAEQSRHFTFLRAAVGEGLVSIAAGKKVTQALRRCGGWVDQRNNQIAGLPSDQVIAGVIRNVPVLISESAMGYAPGDHRFEGLVLLCEAILDEGRSELTQLERGFTLLAELVPLDRLSTMLDRLFFALVPAELERQAAEAEAKRRMDLQRRPDGMWRMNGLLTPECGEYVWTAMSASMRRDSVNPLDTATAAALRLQGLDPYDPDSWPAETRERLLPGVDPSLDKELLPRTRGERLHDAFESLCRTFLDKGLGGSHHKVASHVNVTITDQGLSSAAGSLPAVGDSGALIPRSVLRRWWCDSSVTAFVLAQGGKALRAIHAGRTLTGHERRALLLEQGNACAVRSCRGHSHHRQRGHPGGDLRPHHVRRHADDGITWIDETVMICDTCHRDLHEGGRTLRLRDNRLINEQGWTDSVSSRPPPPF
jgi:hypothetical protein